MPPCLETSRINKQRELIQQQSPELPAVTLTWHASKYKVQFERHAQGSKQGNISPLLNAFFDHIKSTAWSWFLVLAFRAGLFLLRDYSEYEFYRPLNTVCFVLC